MFSNVARWWRIDGGSTLGDDTFVLIGRGRPRVQDWKRSHSAVLRLQLPDLQCVFSLDGFTFLGKGPAHL